MNRLRKATLSRSFERIRKVIAQLNNMEIAKMIIINKKLPKRLKVKAKIMDNILMHASITVVCRCVKPSLNMRW